MKHHAYSLQTAGYYLIQEMSLQIIAACLHIVKMVPQTGRCPCLGALPTPSPSASTSTAEASQRATTSPNEWISCFLPPLSTASSSGLPHTRSVADLAIVKDRSSVVVRASVHAIGPPRRARRLDQSWRLVQSDDGQEAVFGRLVLLTSIAPALRRCYRLAHSWPVTWATPASEIGPIMLSALLR